MENLSKSNVFLTFTFRIQMVCGRASHKIKNPLHFVINYVATFFSTHRFCRAPDGFVPPMFFVYFLKLCFLCIHIILHLLFAVTHVLFKKNKDFVLFSRRHESQVCTHYCTAPPRTATRRRTPKTFKTLYRKQAKS